MTGIFCLSLIPFSLVAGFAVAFGILWLLELFRQLVIIPPRRKRLHDEVMSDGTSVTGHLQITRQEGVIGRGYNRITLTECVYQYMVGDQLYGYRCSYDGEAPKQRTLYYLHNPSNAVPEEDIGREAPFFPAYGIISGSLLSCFLAFALVLWACHLGI